MSDGPSLSDFMRHLQAILEDSEEIPNQEDRETRQFQIESAIQEAILFGNRYKELVEHELTRSTLSAQCPTKTIHNPFRRLNRSV